MMQTIGKERMSEKGREWEVEITRKARTESNIRRN